MNINEYFYNYFDELRTFPSGWDLSGFNDQHLIAGGEASTYVESPWESIKFSEPRTIPSGWDTSGMV